MNFKLALTRQIQFIYLLPMLKFLHAFNYISFPFSMLYFKKTQYYWVFYLDQLKDVKSKTGKQQ